MTDRATYYTISPSADSTLAVELSKTGMSRHKKYLLFFEKFSGEMCFAEKNPAAFRLTLMVDAASVMCRDAGLSEKKRSAVAEFARNKDLAAKAFPEIRFTSHSIRAKPLRGFVVEGALQIGGAVRTVEVSVVLSPRHKDSIQLDGDAALRLSEFALPRPSALFGLVRTKDEVVIRILLWAIPKAETVTATV
jgi:polyisoprenoid-binding protein YceI